jgi:succinate dehydrogenase/fumarate reductase flavoprotein subunit
MKAWHGALATSYDVVVVGSGAAGMTAALSSRQRAARLPSSKRAPSSAARSALG